MRSPSSAVVAAIAGAVLVGGAACSAGGPPAAGPSTAVTSSAASSASSSPPTAATSSASSVPAAPSADSWLGYHADQARTGAVPGPGPTAASVAWSVDLGGAVRGQPLVFGGRIIAATEGDRVVALDPVAGDVLWSASLGTPLTDVAAAAGCGNVDPLGITSTPVIDPSSGTVYAVGEVVDAGGAVHHHLEGLDAATGAVRLSEDVDPPLPRGERAVHLLQRASLALGNGRVYVSYGGNDGDCGVYHGWVVGVREAGPADPVSFEVAPDGHGGAIWQSGGAPALDGQGDVYVTTGNANPDPPAGGPDRRRYTESVVKLSPDLRPLASFKDRTAGGDEDLSTANPVLLPDGTLFAAGKTDVGYLLRQSDLSRVAAITGVCGSDPDGGPAYDAASGRLFVPCRGGGLQVVDVVHHRLGPKLAGADSAPVLVGGHLWALDHTSGTLVEHDPASGARQQAVSLGTGVPVFTSPSAGLGLLLVGTSTGVVAVR